jgi:hypothetical protein
MSVPDEGYPRNASSASNTSTKYKTTSFILSQAYINSNISFNELYIAVNWISMFLFVALLNVGDNVDVEDDI